MATSKIGELADTVGFKGPASHRIAEPSDIRTLPVVDNTSPKAKNVRTSVDCYVSGQYVQKGGKITEVTQRYTIYVGYNRSTQNVTMQQVRDRIVQDFQNRYGMTFNVASVFVPQLMAPPEKQAEDAQLYRGTESFREMSRYEKMRFDIGTEHVKEKTNVESIKKRYKMR